MTRLQDNRDLTAEEHLRFHDRDLDAVDGRLGDLVAEVKGLKTVMIGILVSTSTAAIVAALNLLLGHH